MLPLQLSLPVSCRLCDSNTFGELLGTLKHDSHFGDQALVARALHLQLLWTPRYASDRMIVNILSEATDR